MPFDSLTSTWKLGNPPKMVEHCILVSVARPSCYERDHSYDTGEDDRI